MKHKRSWKNMCLTEAFHVNYMALWIVITVALILSANFLFFLWVYEHFEGVHASATPGQSTYFKIRPYLAPALAVEFMIASLGIAFLAKATAHRIAGPFIQMQKTFDAIRAGDHTARLRFRAYDKLDRLAESFNALADTFTNTKRGP